MKRASGEGRNEEFGFQDNKFKFSVGAVNIIRVDAMIGKVQIQKNESSVERKTFVCFP